MKILGYLCLVLALACAAYPCLYHFYCWAYKRGHRKGCAFGYDEGFLRGRKLEQDWWINTECEADRARQQIWRDKGVKEEGMGWP
jgi:hypothetical protein